MVTMESVESALKNLYLDAAREEINKKANPFLAMISDNTRKVTNGYQAQATVRYANENTIVAGDENGETPTDSGKNAEISTTVKNLYGGFKVSDKMLRLAKNDSFVMANLLGIEMNNLVDSAKRSLNKMVYGNGAGGEINGVESIFGETMYNLDATQSAEIAPHKTELSGDGALTETEILNFLDSYESHCESNPADIMLTHPSVRRALYEQLRENGSHVDLCEFKGGYSGFKFNGIPVYSDAKCNQNTMYALNSKDWAMHEMGDWDWVTSDSGGILNKNDDRATYTATIVKYADLLCDKPQFQGKVVKGA